MKKKFVTLILFTALIVGLSSCKIGSDSNYSPKLTLLNPALLNTDSTLRMSYTNEGNIKFDSLHVNDTITIGVLGEGYTNTLTKFTYTVTETSDIEVIMPDSIRKSFDASSNFVTGNLVFTPKIIWMNLPFKFVAKRPKDKVKINFLLESDAVDVSNQAGMQIEFPIKP